MEEMNQRQMWDEKENKEVEKGGREAEREGGREKKTQIKIFLQV